MGVVDHQVVYETRNGSISGYITLSWKKATDSYQAETWFGTVTVEKAFQINGTDLLDIGEVEDLSILARKTLTPSFDAHTHTPEYHQAVAPTCDEGTYTNGSIEYWYCDGCGRYFTDEDCTTEVAEADTLVPYFTIDDNGTYVRVLSYNGADTEVTVPDTVPDSYPDEAVRGKAITSINQSAFKSNTVINRVVMGDNIQHIGWEAFRYCSNLEEIVIGSGLKQLESYVFAGTEKLTRFTCTTTTGTIGLVAYTFGDDVLPTFYGMHTGSFRTMCTKRDQMTTNREHDVVYLGLDKHVAPTWSWAEDYSSTTAAFNCGSKCHYRETLNAVITVDSNETTIGATVYTAVVTDENGFTYTDTRSISHWTQLQEQINAQEIGWPIVLEQDYTALPSNAALVIPAGQQLVIDLNGHTIDRALTEPTPDGYVIFVGSGAALTIRDSKGGGIITGGNNSNENYAYGGGIVTMGNTGIEGGSITGNAGYAGGGVYVEGPDAYFAMDGGSISGNTATDGGGIACYTSGVVVIRGGEITGNTATDDGGGISFAMIAPANKKLYLNYGTISGNTAGKRGGGICTNVSVPLTLPSPTDKYMVVRDNTAGTEGPDIYFDGDDLLFELQSDYPLPEGTWLGVAHSAAANSVNPDDVIPFTRGYQEHNSASPDTFFHSSDPHWTVSQNADGEAVLCIAPSVTINGVSGSFNDKIKMNYYFGIPEEVLADENAYVTITNEDTGKVETMLIKNAEFVQGKGYKFSIHLAAKEASDSISARVFDGQGNALPIVGASGADYTENGVQYTLMKYFTWLEEKGSDADEKAVGVAAKDYCTATQIYFDYNADGLSVSSAVSAVTTEMLSGYIACREGTLPEGVSIKGITAMLESDNTLRLYLSFKGVEPGDFTYTIAGNATELKQRSDGAYYLAMDTGVWSNKLHEAHTYSVSDGTNTYTITASVLTYARSAAIKSSKKDIDLGKALYVYNQAAVAAFGE